MDVTGPSGALAATPPGVADVLGGFCQESPPPGGHTLAGFDARLDTMAEQQHRLQGAKDYRAVFHLTYLTFSRQVRAALAAGRFADATWAADMSCRFVDAYLQQVQRWERRDPSQCRAWRAAFGDAQSGRANVLQAMFLGMNAHIHYDLAFVTLGACLAAGDLDDVSPDRPSLSRTGVPDTRHLDFLLINQIGWESIPHIQDTVLGAFARPLRWGNKPVARLTRTLGQRLLMDARDTSWGHTTLLVHAHARDDRAAVAAMIDAHAASHTGLVDAMTIDPRGVVGGARRWRARETDLPDAARDQLVRMATTHPAVAELALRQLAFAGVDPAAVMDVLVGEGSAGLAGPFAGEVVRHAPAHRRQDLSDYLAQAGAGPRTAVEVIMIGGSVHIDDLPADAVDAVHGAWRAEIEDAERCLAVSAVQQAGALADALREHQHRLATLLVHTGGRLPPPPSASGSLSLLQAQALLAVHPDAWVRLCASELRARSPDAGPHVGVAIGPRAPDTSGEAGMSQLIEQVLFLKSTSLFLEVDAEALLPVAEALQLRTFDAGSVIIPAGSMGAGIHLIVDGRVGVTQGRDGRQVEVAELGRGAAIGELSALNDAPATADCVARTPVRTAFIETGVLVRVLHQHPRVAVGLIRTLSQRLTATTLQLEGR